MKRIIIVGSRRRNTHADYMIVKRVLFSIYEKGDMIISGGCPKGGDKFAETLSEKYDIPKRIFRAKWKKFGKPAGFIRNTEVAKHGDEMIACVSEDRTEGTEDTIMKFKKFHPNGKIHLC